MIIKLLKPYLINIILYFLIKYKIFKNKTPYEEAIKTINRLWQNKELASSEPMIYDTGVIGNIGNETLYYYFMEKFLKLGFNDEMSFGGRDFI